MHSIKGGTALKIVNTYTAVTIKVVQKKCKRVRDNAER